MQVSKDLKEKDHQMNFFKLKHQLRPTGEGSREIDWAGLRLHLRLRLPCLSSIGAFVRLQSGSRRTEAAQRAHLAPPLNNRPCDSRLRCRDPEPEINPREPAGDL